MNQQDQIIMQNLVPLIVAGDSVEQAVMKYNEARNKTQAALDKLSRAKIVLMADGSMKYFKSEGE